MPKNRLKFGFERVLGSIWEGVGTVWGLSRVLLDASWPFWERPKPSFFQALGQDGLQEAFWLDFWSIWEGLGGVLGGFGEAFGAPLAHLGRPGVELASHLVRMLYVSCCPIFCYRNPRAASLRPAERHNARGSPHRYACWIKASCDFSS